MVFPTMHRQDIPPLSRPSAVSKPADGVNKTAYYVSSLDYGDYIFFPQSDLFAPTRSERSFFILAVAMLFVLSLCGNLLTLCVNCRRHMRPFFRACLISLAISDLITTFLLSITYMGQFTAEYVQYWHYGSAMCRHVPFLTTSAIMVSSLLLVGIATDRYFAVSNATIDVWNPTGPFCCLCMVLMWAASVSISSPIIFIYELVRVYIIDDEGDGQLVLEDNGDPKAVSMCLSNKEKVGMFYMAVFLIIFIPCIVAFLWLNAVIAKTIWQRRRPISTPQSPAAASPPSTAMPPTPMAQPQLQPEAEAPKTNVQLLTVTSNDAESDPTSTTPNSNTTGDNSSDSNPARPARSGETSKARSAREMRHIRMFVVIVLMMLVFLGGRLPAWVLLMLRMYSTYTEDMHWRLYFYFGLLHLSSCMLNPLFYTFLAETIEYARLVKVKVFNTACGLRLCCERTRAARQQLSVPPMPATNYGVEEGCAHHAPALPPEVPPPMEVVGYRVCCPRICGWRLQRNKFHVADAQTKWHAELVAMGVEEEAKPQEGSCERDEGVDVCSVCSGSGTTEDSAGSVRGMHRSSSQIYTIHQPVSRVAASWPGT